MDAQLESGGVDPSFKTRLWSSFTVQAGALVHRGPCSRITPQDPEPSAPGLSRHSGSYPWLELLATDTGRCSLLVSHPAAQGRGLEGPAAPSPAAGPALSYRQPSLKRLPTPLSALLGFAPDDPG